MSELIDRFITAACIPVDGSDHSSGNLQHARELLELNPEIATADIRTAAILGDAPLVRNFVADDPGSATARVGPYGWDPLTYLCFSKYLRDEKNRSPQFLNAAAALLDAGANPNGGFFSDEHQPQPIWESVLYGAAGIAHDPDLTRLLLQRGADPNDGETDYHVSEGFDNRAMIVVAESGKLTANGFATMLVRKFDWTDYDGAAWLLDHGSSANELAQWGNRPLDHALARCSRIEFFALLLDHGANPLLTSKDGVSAFTRSARVGRSDVLDLFEQRNIASDIRGDDRLLEACARTDTGSARAIVAADPGIVSRIESRSPNVVAEFAGAGNVDGLRILLDLGFNMESQTRVAQSPGMNALQLAVWRERIEVVKLLLERGADPAVPNRRGQTARSLALRAQSEGSEWTPHESKEILKLVGG
jgi:ankyrin repeat protein